MTKVLHVVGSLASAHGGPSRSVPSLAAALVARGVACSIVHKADGAPAPREVAAAVDRGVEIFAVANAREAVDLVTGNADIVHLHGLWSTLLHSVAGAAFRGKLPVVVSPRGMLEPWARHHHRIRKTVAWSLFQRRDLQRSTLLHATSDQEEQTIRALGFSRVAVVPNGTDLPPSTASFAGDRRIVFLSRLHEKKGLTMLVEAAARNRDELRLRGWAIVIAGSDEGGHAAVIRRQIAGLAVGDLVTVASEVDGDEKWNLLRSAHVFILPSHSENFGLVIAEALGTGVPVITTTATPWRQIEETRCGWWVPPTVDAIAGALRTAIRTPRTELQAMGLRGRALIAAEYSWDSAAARFESVYNGVLVGGAA